MILAAAHGHDSDIELLAWIVQWLTERLNTVADDIIAQHRVVTVISVLAAQGPACGYRV